MTKYTTLKVKRGEMQDGESGRNDRVLRQRTHCGQRLSREQVKRRISPPVGQEGGFYGWFCETENEETGALKIPLHFVDMDFLQVYIQRYFFIWKKKK